MKANMGNIDRGIRVLIAAVAVVLFFTGILKGILGIVALVFAGIFVATSLVSFCPLYVLFGANTCPAEKKG